MFPSWKCCFLDTILKLASIWQRHIKDESRRCFCIPKIALLILIQLQNPTRPLKVPVPFHAHLWYSFAPHSSRFRYIYLNWPFFAGVCVCRKMVILEKGLIIESYPLRTTTVDGRIIQTLIHRQPPLTPNINVIFLFGSFLRIDEINQTPRAGTALRNHNIEIRGRSGVAYNSWIGVWISSAMKMMIIPYCWCVILNIVC